MVASTGTIDFCTEASDFAQFGSKLEATLSNACRTLSLVGASLVFRQSIAASATDCLQADHEVATQVGNGTGQYCLAAGPQAEFPRDFRGHMLAGRSSHQA